MIYKAMAIEKEIAQNDAGWWKNSQVSSAHSRQVQTTHVRNQHLNPSTALHPFGAGGGGPEFGADLIALPASSLAQSE